MNQHGRFISALGKRTLRADLPSDLAAFRDEYHRHDLFISRALVKDLSSAGLRGFCFDDLATGLPETI
jgi:hypothetical protein